MNRQPVSKASTNRADVIVVGGRAAGAATALLLARRGLRVLLVDQGRLSSDTLSTHALMRGAVLQLHRWGLLDGIVAAGTPAVKQTTFRYGEEKLRIAVKPSNGVDSLYAPRRTVLDPLLLRAAVEAGVDVREQTAVTHVITHDGRVVGVRAIAGSTRPVELRATLVIGADGVRSTVAREVGARAIRVGDHASAASYGYWSDLETDGYEWTFRANACSGIIPTNDGQACVFASAPAARVGRGGVAVIEDIVGAGAPDVAERLRAATPPRGTRTWHGHAGYIRQAHGHGWALVGDAGYYKDPLSAHGLTDAFRDAELLAGAVVDGLGGTMALDASLARYQAVRDRLSMPLFDIVDRIASHRWDDVEIAGLLRHLSSLLTDEADVLASLDPSGIGSAVPPVAVSAVPPAAGTAR